MKTALNFEQEETKKLLASFDFEYFLKQNIPQGGYLQSQVDEIYSNCKSEKGKLELLRKKNHKQFNHFCEGKVRKMFTGGFLPALFHLDENLEYYILDFKGAGESWAYFNEWKRYYNRKVTSAKIWNTVVKVGSILAIILSVLKILESVVK